MSAYETAAILLGYNGYKIQNKTGYIKSNPNNIIIFDCHVVFGGQKIWCGDIDLTVSYKKLNKLAKALNGPIFIHKDKSAPDYDTRFALVKITRCRIQFLGALKLVCRVEKDGVPRIKNIESDDDIKPKNTSFGREHIIKSITLPPVKDLNHSRSVLVEFFKFVENTSGGMNYENFYVSSAYAAQLMQTLINQIKKEHPDLSDKEAEELAAWEWLDLGPNYFQIDPEWLVDKLQGYWLDI